MSSSPKLHALENVLLFPKFNTKLVGISFGLIEKFPEGQHIIGGHVVFQDSVIFTCIHAVVVPYNAMQCNKSVISLFYHM